MQKDVIEATIEIQLTNQAFRIIRDLLETLSEIENKIKDLSNCVKSLMRDDAKYRNKIVNQTYE